MSEVIDARPIDIVILAVCISSCVLSIVNMGLAAVLTSIAKEVMERWRKGDE